MNQKVLCESRGRNSLAIPQINAEQVAALTEMAQGAGAISVMLPDMKKDNYEKYNLLTAELCDLNQLVILGLLKEISSECGEKLATMYAVSNRLWSVYQITDMGYKMFDGVERRIQ
jgi:hypothetical protein